VTGRHARRVRYACTARVLAQLRLACHISQARESTCSLFLTLTQHLTHTHHLPRTIPHTKSLFPYPTCLCTVDSRHTSVVSPVCHINIYTHVYIYMYMYLHTYVCAHPAIGTAAVCLAAPHSRVTRLLMHTSPSFISDIASTPQSYVTIIQM